LLISVAQAKKGKCVDGLDAEGNECTVPERPTCYDQAGVEVDRLTVEVCYDIDGNEMEKQEKPESGNKGQGGKGRKLSHFKPVCHDENGNEIDAYTVDICYDDDGSKTWVPGVHEGQPCYDQDGVEITDVDEG